MVAPNRLTPIPDRHRDRGVIPPALLRADDRTVYMPVRQAWASAPIEWSKPVVKPISGGARRLVDSDLERGSDWDDSGWISTAR